MFTSCCAAQGARRGRGKMQELPSAFGRSSAFYQIGCVVSKTRMATSSMQAFRAVGLKINVFLR